MIAYEYGITIRELGQPRGDKIPNTLDYYISIDSYLNPNHLSVSDIYIAIYSVNIKFIVILILDIVYNKFMKN